MPRIAIGNKLVGALAIPVVALALLTALEVVKTSNQVEDMRRQTDVAVSAMGPAGLITTLQNERTWAIVELVGIEDVITVQEDGYDATRTQTDRATAEFRAETVARGHRVAAAFRPALDGLAETEAIRAEIDAHTGPRSLGNAEFARLVFDRYTALIEPLFDATTQISSEVNDAELRQGARMADAAARQIETLSRLMIVTLADALVSPGGIDQPGEISEIARLHAGFRRHANVMRTASGTYARIAARSFPEGLTQSVTDLVQQGLSTGTVDLTAALASLDVPRDEGYMGYQSAVHAAVERRANGLNSAAESRRLWFTVLSLAAVVAAAVVTWRVSGSITKPLRSLTRQATDMAQRRLPGAVRDILQTPLGEDVQIPATPPIVVHTRDEVANVADALNTVQESALHLAVEQAVLRRNIADSFVNLGRRNQNLLSRQLDFITELESNEADPDALAALFRLDHQATRMRRNAESLLVLAGVEPARKWSAPVRVTDVIRSALGEVDGYQRVAIRQAEPATVFGFAAADLAHLIAELLENALAFSPPDRTVDVWGLHGPEGHYSLVIVDSGTGMTPDELDNANRRLAGAESFTVAPSKYLGHYVAGHLAARHGIDLWLENTPGRGVTATIDLPPELQSPPAVVPGIRQYAHSYPGTPAYPGTRG